VRVCVFPQLEALQLGAALKNSQISSDTCLSEFQVLQFAAVVQNIEVSYDQSATQMEGEQIRQPSEAR